MKHLAEKIVIYQINQGIITNDEKENYIYAYFILMEQTINIFIAFSIGIITGNVIYVISFLISYIWLRTFGGGYHARTVQQCCISSIGIIILICVIKNHNFINEKLLDILLSMCNIIIFLLAPIESKNKLLNQKEKRRNHRNTIMTLILEELVMICLMYLGKKEICLGIKTAILIFTVFLVIGKKINNTERDEKLWIQKIIRLGKE